MKSRLDEWGWDGRNQRTFSGLGRLEGERKARKTIQGRENMWGQGYRIFSLRTALVGNIKRSDSSHPQPAVSVLLSLPRCGNPVTSQHVIASPPPRAGLTTVWSRYTCGAATSSVHTITNVPSTTSGGCRTLGSGNIHEGLIAAYLCVSDTLSCIRRKIRFREVRNGTGNSNPISSGVHV
ncbi:hypothetical protein E2C01_064053 [Portunus trituberculatus]|uniref:Uncharacterized protein n=1 Tax=Portunus trituberculatus TaxID=210409 RepID=A0A5B7HF98_PORTR|nr:hypothetical protein [Portunus trituberculatus]